MGYLVCDNCKAYYKLPKGSDYTKFRSSCICGNDLKYFESLNESSMKNFDNLICPNCGTENPKNSKFCLDCGSKLNQFETYAQKLKKSIQTREQLQTKEQIPKKESMNKFCPSCGNENIADADFCKICGKKLEDMTGKCPYCAEEINPHAIKCKHCGEWLNKKSQPQKVYENHTFAIILGIIFTIFGGIIGLVISFYLVTRKDERAHNAGAVLLIVNIVWIILLLIIYSYISWMYSVNSYYY